MSCRLQETKEVLLLQAELLALGRFVVGIKDLGQVFRSDLLIHRPVIVADVECLEVEGFAGLGLPQPQDVAGVDLVAQDRGVVGNPPHRAVGNPAHPEMALLVDIPFGPAAHPHLNAHFGPAYLPGIAELEPFVGIFHLPAILDPLIEDAELVADAIADGRHLEGGQGIDVAGGEPS